MAKSPHTLSLFSSALHPATCSDDHGGHVRRGGAAWQSTGGGRAGARGERRRQWTLTWTERASPQRQTLDEATRRKGGPRRCRQSHRAHTQSTHTHRQSTHTEHTQSILRVRLNTHTHSHTYTHARTHVCFSLPPPPSLFPHCALQNCVFLLARLQSDKL